jgi:hypothetical protein
LKRLGTRRLCVKPGNFGGNGFLFSAFNSRRRGATSAMLFTAYRMKWHTLCFSFNNRLPLFDDDRSGENGQGVVVLMPCPVILLDSAKFNLTFFWI